MNKRKTKALKIRFEEDMFETIEQMAIENDTSLSEVIRYLIKEGLESNDKH